MSLRNLVVGVGLALSFSSASAEQFRGWDVAELEQAMATRPIVKIKDRMSRSEPVYWLELEGGLEVAFKPETQTRPGLYRWDLAARALATLLGIEARVPPVGLRSIPFADLDVHKISKLKPHKTDKTLTFGNVFFWMPTLEKTGLANNSGRMRWGRWLSQKAKAPTGDDDRRARQMAELVVFDYLQSNSDRFDNGPNMMADEHGDLVYRDNNDAWSLWLLKQLDRNRPELEMVQRFPRTLVEHMRTVATGEALASAVKRWAENGTLILEPKQIAAYEKRRKVVLEHIDRMIKKYGEERVLVWP